MDPQPAVEDSPRNLMRGLVLSYLCGTWCQRTGCGGPGLGAH